jgi:hypothetical protein
MKLAARLSILIALGALGPAACSATPPAPDAWIETLIAGFEAEPVANPPHRIVRYRYDEKHVYYVPAVCCDQPSTLYDDQGQVVCQPDGGFSGRGDNRCPDFASRRRDETLIWSDPRPRD